jgi:hypothetical protein
MGWGSGIRKKLIPDTVAKSYRIPYSEPVLRIRIRIPIRIHQTHMFLGLPDPDPLVRGMDPDPSIIMQK